MYAFDFIRPASLSDALAALQDEDAQPLAGGQTLIPTLRQRLAMPGLLVSLTGIADLQGVCRNDAGETCIGAATTHADVARLVQTYDPALAALAGQIGDAAVRNRGTIGGSLANNDPSACYPAAVLATGATIVAPHRLIAADDYFQGIFTTALDAGEIISEVRFPTPQRAAYVKFAQPASRFALVGVYVAQFPTGVRVAVTGAAQDGVFRWTAAEKALDAAFTPDALDRLGVDADDMMADVHADAAYRAHLVGVICKRAVAAANAG